MADIYLKTIVGFFLPGVCQIYEGETQKGVAMLIIALVLWSFIPYSPLIIIAALIYQIYSACEIYKSGEDKDRDKRHIDLKSI